MDKLIQTNQHLAKVTPGSRLSGGKKLERIPLLDAAGQPAKRHQKSIPNISGVTRRIQTGQALGQALHGTINKRAVQHCESLKRGDRGLALANSLQRIGRIE